MKKTKTSVLTVLLAVFSLTLFSFVSPEGDDSVAKAEGNEENSAPVARVYTNKEDNQVCLKCHLNSHIEFKAEGAEKIFKQRMFIECIIDTFHFYSSNHWNFKCTDCHTDEYSVFPHRGELRFEEIPGCLDCHGGDPKYEKFKFEQIDAEYQKSVHFQRQPGSFSCYSCHDGHYYKINARNRKEDILGAIQYDNDICLSCHANTGKYQMISNKVNPSILAKHDWLPNQPNHFKKVRCIECHAEVNDSLVVSHNILPKSKAVKKCEECHSTDSRLMASLYKYQLQSKGRFRIDNAAFSESPVLIGGKRNVILKMLGNIALLLTLSGVAIHGILRIYSKK
ncbi:MAG: cytochrome c3 family protein [Bacteroidales bacterium]